MIPSRCICPKGYDGPQCEIVSIGFNGDGWALYESVETCEESHLSLELRPRKPNGLVFYVGPTVRPNADFYVQGSKEFIVYTMFVGDFATVY